MFDLILENKNGDRLTFDQPSPFKVTEIQGLNPTPATINTSEVAMIDGAKFNSAKLNMRTINVAFAIEVDPAKNRLEVFKVLKPKELVKLIYKNLYRHVWIEGYVQKVDISYFAKVQVVTCTILCPSPYLKGMDPITSDLSNVSALFHFPFHSTASKDIVFGEIETDTSVSIENGGDIACGLTIELYAKKAISDPKIFNYVTGEYIGLDFDMIQGDLITINTEAGNKTVTLLRDAVETNIFNHVISGSTWLQLSPAGDTFVYEVGTGDAANLQVTFHHDVLYEGV